MIAIQRMFLLTQIICSNLYWRKITTIWVVFQDIGQFRSRVSVSLGLNLMINDVNENILDFVTELVVWSQPLSRQQSISQNSFLSLFQFLHQWRIKLCLNLEMLITDLLIPGISVWQTVVGIDIMVLEQVSAVNWMGNWFSSQCRVTEANRAIGWLKCIKH